MRKVWFVVFILTFFGCLKKENKRYERVVIRGNSMYPTLKNLQPIVIDKHFYETDFVKKGDVVVVRLSPQKRIVKRVVAITGDKIKTDKKNAFCYLYINEKVIRNSLEYPHLFKSKACQMFSLYINDYKGKIPDDGVLLLGDNLEESMDSKEFGLLSVSQIEGKVIL